VLKALNVNRAYNYDYEKEGYNWQGQGVLGQVVEIRLYKEKEL
jgi:hypothetical protein